MASFTFLGQRYETDEFLRECIGLAAQLAKNARLDNPLPPNVDFSPTEQKEVQSQINAMMILPEFALADFWSAFIAHHLQKLVSTLHNLSRDTQRQAFSTLIQIMSLLGGPNANGSSYFRKFLTNKALCIGLPNLIADSFVKGIEWKRPSGPGSICTLIIDMLFWCATSLGDDGKSSIDKQTRTELAAKLQGLIANPSFERLPELQCVDISRLQRVLKAIEGMPEDYYLKSSHEYLVGQAEGICGNSVCETGEEPRMQCSKCKSVRYCCAACQKVHWRNGHKLRCFDTPY